ncbi:methylamine utilization protein [Marinomonas sp. C2222]|uniref:Methylamine utilization protein n=1 Tax=Marinomonas sargassi TaxID=2984494 RepID=A0ABT2YQH1_9GAMM|nr:methylamine utilization protein [Marinomonas sargassi]MCV2402142.1 methylamine utilization protein [Marinomonas sargassi]
MRYLFSVVCFFLSFSVLAEVTLTIVDQDGLPVSDAVIMVPGEYVETPADIAVMEQIKSDFLPRVLIVQKGQYATFPNLDNYRHHVYSFSIPKAFELKLFKGTEVEPVLFDNSGVVVLGCNIHDSMIGYVLVADNAYTVKTNQKGMVTIPATIDDNILLWSERLIEGVNFQKEIKITNSSEQTIQLELYPSI